MVTARTVARVALAGVALNEAVQAASRYRSRKDLYAAAVARAAATGRRLVVVGAPDAGLHTRLLPAYGCGDVCVDLNGCPGCPRSEAVDLTTGRTSVPDDSAVVYVSCVLEYVPDFPAALREVERMAGSRENLFNVVVQPWTLTGSLYPAAVSSISQEPGGRLTATPVSPVRKAVLAAGLVALGIVAFRSPEPRDNPRRRRGARKLR